MMVDIQYEDLKTWLIGLLRKSGALSITTGWTKSSFWLSWTWINQVYRLDKIHCYQNKITFPSTFCDKCSLKNIFSAIGTGDMTSASHWTKNLPIDPDSGERGLRIAHYSLEYAIAQAKISKGSTQSVSPLFEDFLRM